MANGDMTRKELRSDLDNALTGLKRYEKRIAEEVAQVAHGIATIHDQKKRIAELEDDFHKMAVAVLGQIEHGEASVRDVLNGIRRLSDSENESIDRIAELEADNEGWQRSHSEDQHRIHDLKAKVNDLEAFACRIDHGASSGGHLEGLQAIIRQRKT